MINSPRVYIFNMILASQRLNIRHYTAHDLENFKAILMNDTIMKGIRGKGHSAEAAKQRFQDALATNEKYDDLGFFNVTKKDTNELVGFAKLVTMDDGNLPVGYALLEELWGFGFASEITAALVAHALSNYPTKEIIGVVNVENRASQHVLTKQQFKLKSTDMLANFEVGYYYYSK